MSTDLKSGSSFIRSTEYSSYECQCRANEEPYDAIIREAKQEKEVHVRHFIQYFPQKAGRLSQFSKNAMHYAGKEDRCNLEETLEAVTDLIQNNPQQVFDIMQKFETTQKATKFEQNNARFWNGPYMSNEQLNAEALFNKMIGGYSRGPTLGFLDRVSQNYLTLEHVPSSTKLFDDARRVRRELRQLKRDYQQTLDTTNPSIPANLNGKDKDKS